MEQPSIRFDDGDAYDDFMGAWSRLAADVFLDWLAPVAGWRWLDVGCGNGAFTERLIRHAAPSEVCGIDPSEAQLDSARTRLASDLVRLQTGEAMKLPYPDAAFDAATMALVIFFVPDPARGVAEMARVVKPGGQVSAYAWDILGQGFPYAALQEEMAALGSPPLWPPSVEAARLDALRALWVGAGLVDIELREIEVERTYADFDAFWATARKGPRNAPTIDAMPSVDVQRLKERLRARLPADAQGQVTFAGRANAVRGRVPA